MRQWQLPPPPPVIPARRSIFVSYHHAVDQWYYNEFSRLFSDAYGVLQDHSLTRLFDSDDADYVIRRIRERYVSGSSCTVVLCGPMTRWRKYVDWEIKATLDMEHGLIGVNLPHNPTDPQGRVHKPDRLQDNIDSGYALWIQWSRLTQGPAAFRVWVELAIASEAHLVRNTRPLRVRNGP